MIRWVVVAVALSGPAMATDFSYGAGAGAYAPGTPSYGTTTPQYAAPGYTPPSYGAPGIGTPGYPAPAVPPAATPGAGGQTGTEAKAAPARIPVRRRGVIVPGQFVDAPAPKPYDPLLPPGITNAPPTGVDRFLPPR